MAQNVIDGMEDVRDYRRDTRRAEARDTVEVVNLGYTPGKRLYFQQRVFVMPEQGKTFRVPQRYVDALIKSSNPGWLAYPYQVASAKAGVGLTGTLPPGFVAVSVEDAKLLAELREAKAHQADAEVDAETADILNAVD